MLRISVLTLTCINSNSVNEFILFQSRGFQWEWEAVTFLLFRTELNYSKILHKEIHIYFVVLKQRLILDVFFKTKFWNLSIQINV